MTDISDNGGDDGYRRGSDDDGTSDRGQKPGFRKDGKPFKEGNTRADGSYDIGKNRTPEHSQFKKGDGRKRGGGRKKGSQNVGTAWRKALTRKYTLDGRTQLGIEWIPDAIVRRAITRSDRAAEMAMTQAARYFDRPDEGKLRSSEQEMMDAWLAQRFAELAEAESNDADPDKQEAGEGVTEAGDRDAGGDDATQ